MTRSLAVRRGLKRLRIGTLYSLAGMVVLAVILGIAFPTHPWASVALGAATGAAFLGMSWLTSTLTLDAEEPSVLWVGVDYVVKILVAIGILVIAKQVAVFDPIVVVIPVIAGIAAGSGVQVAAFAPEKRRVVPSQVDE